MNPLPTLSSELALKHIKAIVKERGPDYKYTDVATRPCKYRLTPNLTGGEDRCIIGELCHRMGITDTQLKPFDDCPGGKSAKFALPTLFDIESKLLLALDGFQDRQDKGTEYGVALTRFEKDIA